jgi:amidase
MVREMLMRWVSKEASMTARASITARAPRLAMLTLCGSSVLACGGGGGDDQISEPDAMVDEIAELDLPMREQVARMEAGTLTSSTLLANYRVRMTRIDDRGINAVLSHDPQAETVASTVDGQRGQGALLQGAVLLIKDNIDTAGLATTAGSIALAHNVPAKDAFVVARVRAANAVIEGKSNLSEWANFRGFGSTSGWSSVGQQTTHFAVAAFSPCGSSAGSGAAVAANEISAALGTETNGSIICPASVNGVVGFKPTVGLVSRAGVIPVSSTQDTVGPITRDVGDAARLLHVIAGPDADDPATASIPTDFDFDFEAQLATATLAGKRIGVLRNAAFDAGTLALYDTELARLAAAGAILVEVTLPDAAAFGTDSYTVMTTEFKVGIDAYLASHATAGQPGSLEDLISFNNANAAIVMPYFGQQIFLDAQLTTGTSSPGYLTAKANAHAAAGDNGILAVMSANNLDALVSPTVGPTWAIDYARGDVVGPVSGSYPAVAGYPHLTVPMGTVGGLPVGLSLFGRPFDDGKLLALGFAYEQVRPAKRTAISVDQARLQTPRVRRVDPRSRAGM